MAILISAVSSCAFMQRAGRRGAGDVQCTHHMAPCARMARPTYGSPKLCARVMALDVLYRCLELLRSRLRMRSAEGARACRVG